MIVSKVTSEVFWHETSCTLSLALVSVDVQSTCSWLSMAQSRSHERLLTASCCRLLLLGFVTESYPTAPCIGIHHECLLSRDKSQLVNGKSYLLIFIVKSEVLDSKFLLHRVLDAVKLKKIAKYNYYSLLTSCKSFLCVWTWVLRCFWHSNNNIRPIICSSGCWLMVDYVDMGTRGWRK